jgi:hypothetical protein
MISALRCLARPPRSIRYGSRCCSVLLLLLLLWCRRTPRVWHTWLAHSDHLCSAHQRRPFQRAWRLYDVFPRYGDPMRRAVGAYHSSAFPTMMFPEEEAKLLLADRTLVDLRVGLPWRRHDVADSAVRGGAAPAGWLLWERCECNVAGGVSALVAVEARRGAQVDGGVSGCAWGYVRIVAPFLCGCQASLAIGRRVAAEDRRARQSVG